MRFNDLTGQTHGKFTFIQFVGRNNGISMWEARCECGSLKTVRGAHVKTGQIKSCGCDTKHKVNGMSQSKLYAVFNAMHNRCRNPKSKSYARYGGRGIKVCERWHNFQNFVADMGEPEPGQSIDRINNDGNYEPGNCRWADMETQQNNRCFNRRFTFDGKSLTISQWARELGITRQAMRSRISSGSSYEQKFRKSQAA